MQPFNRNRDVIALWPNRAALADDVAMNKATVRAWWNTDSIPPIHFDKVINAAARRGFDGVTYAVLARIAREGRS